MSSTAKHNMILATLALTTTLAFGLSGCTRPDGSMSRETVGSVVGAVAGAVIGSRVGSGGGNVVGASVGTFVGSTIGREIGRGMDQADMDRLYRAQEQAYTAPIGETISWDNPDTQNYGTITPTRQGTSANGRYCREFQQTITIGGTQEQAYGTACQQPDGSWQIINN